MLWIIANLRGTISAIRKIGQPYCIKKLDILAKKAILKPVKKQKGNFREKNNRENT